MDILQEIYLLEKEVERKWQNKDCIVGAKKFAELLTDIVKNCSIPVVVGQSEQLVCSCGSRLVNTTGGYHCGNAKCNV